MNVAIAPSLPAGVSAVRARLLFCLCAMGLGFATSSASATPTSQQLIGWGEAVYGTTASSLLVPGGNGLFAEIAHSNGTQSGGDSGFSYVWPAATQMRAYDDLVRIDPVTYTPVLLNFSNQLYTHYWSASGGYRSGVSAGATQFYDDNAHMAVALAQAYQITGNATYLARAQNTYNFVLSGEDDSPQSGGGGIYFNTDRSFKDSAATLQGARAALLLYESTGQQKYLTDATRLYTWEKNTLQQSDGLFQEKYYVTGPQAGTISTTTLVNFTGMGISDNVQFYKTTHNAAYLTEAERIANRSITRFFNITTGAIQDEGFWSFELVTALDDLYEQDKNVKWLQATQTAMQWLRDNGQDPNGHYATLWGRGGNISGSRLIYWDDNDQVGPMVAYLDTGLTQVPEPTGLVVGFAGLAITLLRRSRRK
ncbi:MAG: Alpha-l-arabinofuranosidase b (Abfb) family protein [Phycisphaerales bacterium]|nr:Alpha-l-arabinofuranosidase b (Abfb) family protein [Phycisphaerales bacterium]